MESLRKWLNKPKADDKSLLARFYHADKSLTSVASELDSFDGRAEPERCSRLVGKLRQGQERVLSITNIIMDELLGEDRAQRAFRAKFPEEVLQESLAGQLWFGAECLAAGSSIINREYESAVMRPLAKAVTKSLDKVRKQLREQCLRNNIPNSQTLNLNFNDVATETLYESLKIFDLVFAEFEFLYVSAMVQVKTIEELEMQELICVLFSETLQRSLKIGLLEQEQVDYFDPALMFSIPRLAIVSGLVIFNKGPLNMNMPSEELSEMFRPFRTLLIKIRDLLRTLTKNELYQLEKLLCTNEEIHLKTPTNVCDDDNNNNNNNNNKLVNNSNSIGDIVSNVIKENDVVNKDVSNVYPNNSNNDNDSNNNNNNSSNNNENINKSDNISNSSSSNNNNAAVLMKNKNINNNDNDDEADDEGNTNVNANADEWDDEADADDDDDGNDENNKDAEDNDHTIHDLSPNDNLVIADCASGYLIPNTNFGNLLQTTDAPLTDSFISSDDEFNAKQNNVRETLDSSTDLNKLLLINNSNNSNNNNNNNSRTLMENDSGMGTGNTSGVDRTPEFETQEASLTAITALANRATAKNRIEIRDKLKRRKPSNTNRSINSVNSIESINSRTSTQTSTTATIFTAVSAATTTDAINCVTTTASASASSIVMATNESINENTNKNNDRTKSHHKIRIRDKTEKRSSRKSLKSATSITGTTTTTTTTSASSTSSLNNNTATSTSNITKSSSSSLLHSKRKSKRLHTKSCHDDSSSTTSTTSSESSEFATASSSVSVASSSASSSSATSSSSDSDAQQEIALAVRNAGRLKFKNTENLLHRLFVCIAGVADQLQTNFASDLRQILRSVFLMNVSPPSTTTDEDDALKITNKSKDSDLFEFRASEHDVIQENAGSSQSIYSAEEVNVESDSVFEQQSSQQQQQQQLNQPNIMRGERSSSLENQGVVIRNVERSRSLGEDVTENNARRQYPIADNKRTHSVREQSNLSNSNSNTNLKESSPTTRSTSNSPINMNGVNNSPLRNDRSSSSSSSSSSSLSFTTSPQQNLTENQQSQQSQPEHSTHPTAIHNCPPQQHQQQQQQHQHQQQQQQRRQYIAEIPPQWVPDCEAPRCMACSLAFTTFRRRHHCRNCGGVFCSGCSNSTAPLPKFGLIKAVRVCRNCYVREVGT